MWPSSSCWLRLSGKELKFILIFKSSARRPYYSHGCTRLYDPAGKILRFSLSLRHIATALAPNDTNMTNARAEQKLLPSSALMSMIPDTTMTAATALRTLWSFPFCNFFSTVWWARHLSDHANPCNIEFYILTDMVNSLKQVDKFINICFQYLIWRWNTIQSHYLVPLKSWAVAATTISVCKGWC